MLVCWRWAWRKQAEEVPVGSIRRTGVVYGPAGWLRPDYLPGGASSGSSHSVFCCFRHRHFGSCCLSVQGLWAARSCVARFSRVGLSAPAALLLPPLEPHRPHFPMATSVGNVADSTGTVACVGTGVPEARQRCSPAEAGYCPRPVPRGGLRPPGPPLACPERGAPCSPGPLPAELSRSGGLGEAVAPGAAPAAFVLVSLHLGVPMGPGLSLGGLLSALPGRSLRPSRGGERRD